MSGIFLVRVLSFVAGRLSLVFSVCLRERLTAKGLR
jgi:hypothetical protein